MEELRLKHFKAFADSICMQCANRKNVLLFGENGAGKTSLFDALKYVFYKDKIEVIDDMLPAVDKKAKLIRLGQNIRMRNLEIHLKSNLMVCLLKMWKLKNIKFLC